MSAVWAARLSHPIQPTSINQKRVTPKYVKYVNMVPNVAHGTERVNLRERLTVSLTASMKASCEMATRLAARVRVRRGSC